jgi:hypothetical protein
MKYQEILPRDITAVSAIAVTTLESTITLTKSVPESKQVTFIRSKEGPQGEEPRNTIFVVKNC